MERGPWAAGAQGPGAGESSLKARVELDGFHQLDTRVTFPRRRAVSLSGPRDVGPCALQATASPPPPRRGSSVSAPSPFQRHTNGIL